MNARQRKNRYALETALALDREHKRQAKRSARAEKREHRWSRWIEIYREIRARHIRECLTVAA